MAQIHDGLSTHSKRLADGKREQLEEVQLKNTLILWIHPFTLDCSSPEITSRWFETFICARKDVENKEKHEDRSLQTAWIIQKPFQSR